MSRFTFRIALSYHLLFDETSHLQKSMAHPRMSYYFARYASNGYHDMWISRARIPSAWTFRRVFSRLQPEVIETLLCTHAAMLVKQTAGEEATPSQICIDGKALRGSKRHDLRVPAGDHRFCSRTGSGAGTERRRDARAMKSPLLRCCWIYYNSKEPRSALMP